MLTQIARPNWLVETHRAAIGVNHRAHREIKSIGQPWVKQTLGNSGWRSDWGTIFGVLKLDFDSYERYLDFETRVLHRNSSRIELAEWFGLGSHFGKMLVVGSISKNKMSCFWKPTQNMVSGPNVPRGPKGHYKIDLAWNGLAAQNNCL